MRGVGQSIIVGGIPYRVHAWTGGDTPDVLYRGHTFMQIRGELYREQWALYVAYWYEAPGSDVRQTFWNRAHLDAWRTVTEHERRGCDTRMTLEEWAKGWPYTVHLSDSGMRWTPDSACDDAYRAQAWRLRDYRVSSVTGGSIWFMVRR